MHNPPQRAMLRAQAASPAEVLIATLGSKPQVVTTALDLLRRQSRTIRELIVIHTLSAHGPMPAVISQLQIEFTRHAPYRDVALRFQPIVAADEPINDTSSEADAEAVFRTLYRAILNAKRSGQAVHLSIVGGRKVFAVYAMAAAQLLFDDQDHLWYVLADGDFLSDERWHPAARDQARLVPIPVLRWGTISPALTDISQIDDPLAAVNHQRERLLRAQIEEARSFVLGSLTGAQRNVVALLVRAGLADTDIADRLALSVRTVERHLGEAYAKAAAHWDMERVSRTQLVALLSVYYALADTAARPPEHSPINGGNPS